MAYESKLDTPFGTLTFNLDQMDADARAQIEQAKLLLEDCYGKGYDQRAIFEMLERYAQARPRALGAAAPIPID